MSAYRPSDEDLILHFYGEAENAAEIAAALAASPAERERYAALERVLRAAGAIPAPEPLAGYGARVWRKIEPRLAPRRAGVGRWLSLPRLGWAALLAAALGAAYLAGRSTLPEPPAQIAGGFSAESRQRILNAALAHHLEKTERLLVELDNGGPTLSADFSQERRRAEELVEANRLYRQAAREGGVSGLGPLLDELEPLLLEVAHAPARGESEPLTDRLSRPDLLFKVRIMNQRLQRATQPSSPPRRAGDVL